MKKVFLDNGSTTMVPKEVVEAMLPFFGEKYGNASTIYEMGVEAQEAVQKSRETIASKLGAEPAEVYFTSGGTESNNLALKGVSFANKKRGKHVITSKIEHSCVLESCKWLESQGFKVTYLDVDEYGFVAPEALKKALTKDTVLVSVIHANNEIGTVEPIKELAGICRDAGAYFHTDACQSFTKLFLNVEKQGLDLATINAHKIHGPKGVGALFVREGTKIIPWQHGGGHEQGLRSGTENVPGIVGFAKASQLVKQKDVEKMTRLRDKVIKNALRTPDTKLNGHPEKRLCNNAHFAFRGIDGEAIVLGLDDYGIQVATGSACSSHSNELDHVLLAIGLKPEETHGSLRVTLSKYTAKDEIGFFNEKLNETVNRLRQMSPMV